MVKSMEDQSRTFCAYLRVSTDRQGKLGLGLEAQQASITGFLREGDRIIGTFLEVESGTKAGRPELHKALARCKATGATLFVAKLDRLARDAHFLLGLQKAGADFIAVDMPHANRLTIGIMALVAEEEARLISARTKAALGAAKARGVKLRGDRGYRPETPPDAAKGAAASAEAGQATASRFRFWLLPMVQEMRDKGDSLRAIAAALEAKGIATPRQGGWTAAGVRRVLGAD